MNTENVLQENSPRYEELAKPKKRTDRSSNFDAFHVKRGALSYQITDSINKLAQPKKKQGTTNTSDSIIKTLNPSNAANQLHRKLINNSELSRDAQESKKRKFLLDTYARITAARNKGCSKRLHELAKPKLNSTREETFEDFDNYFQTIKKYNGGKPLIGKKG